MGEVYLAVDSRLGREVALKTVSEARLESPGARRALLKEARAAAHLNHPNIAAIYDVLETPELSAIVMEYVAGQTLATLVLPGPLNSDRVVEIGVQLCEGLAAAHDAGVIHRDLKPANLILTPSGRVKVLDFGLARVPEASLASDSAQNYALTPTQDGRVVGTPAYMSPEQVLGHPVDERSDIYSLGVVFFELLTGQRPFRGHDLQTLANNVLTEKTPVVSEFNPSVPPPLSQLVARAMARNPIDRFARVGDLRKQLDEVCRISEMPTLSAGYFKASSRSRLTIWGAVLAGGIALLAATLASERAATIRHAATAQPVVAVLPFADQTEDRSQDTYGIGVADAVTRALARLPSVTVVPIEESSRGMGSHRNSQEVAHELGASHIVEGAIVGRRESWQLSLRLFDAGSKKVIWERSYGPSAGDVSGTLRTVIGDIASALNRKPSEATGLGPSPSVPRSEEAYADYLQGRSFLARSDAKGSVEHAVQLLEKAIAIDPGFAAAHAALGEASLRQYERTRNAEFTIRARDAILEAQRLDPGLPEVHLALAVLLKATGRTAEAIEELQKTIRSQPWNADAYRTLGNALMEAGRAEDGLAALRRAVALRPDYWGNMQDLGLAFFSLGRFGDAVQAFKRVTELQPDNWRGYLMLGVCDVEAGRHVDGERAYRRAIELGQDASAYSNLGALLYSQGRFPEASDAFAKAVSGEPQEPVYRRNLGDAYRRQGRPEKAREQYAKAASLVREELKVNPKDAQSIAMLSVYQAKLGNFAEALELMTKARQLAPTSAEVMYRSAVVESLSGRGPQAAEALRSAIGLGYSTKLAAEDEDLISIVGRPDMSVLLAHRPSPN